MRAVNQSIGMHLLILTSKHCGGCAAWKLISAGRAIRHANDYATILLVDKRYATNRIRSKLPKWIGENVQTPADFGGVAKGIAGFFREKRARKV